MIGTRRGRMGVDAAVHRELQFRDHLGLGDDRSHGAVSQTDVLDPLHRGDGLGLVFSRAREERIPSFSRLEFAFAAHRGRTRRKLLAVDHAPGSYMALRVQGQPAIWVIVLG